MNCRVAIFKKVLLLILFCIALCNATAFCQEANSDFNSSTSYHNQLVYNRFLINPAFSLVRENKSYVNILHQNQYATFNDNNQNYFLGFGNKLNDNTAMGLGVYTNRSGVMQEFGLNANYATAVQLGRNSKLSFGTNVTYLNAGIDKNRIIASENDPEILDARNETRLALQPGVVLSMGQLDFGLYAQDLISYNQTTNSVITDFSENALKASVQYTHELDARRGLFTNGRIMPLVQVHRDEEENFSIAGSVLLDLPDYGWVQSTLDDRYGLSVGLGFNLGKKMTLGYVFEKNFLKYGASLGWNHELSLAYTFKNDFPETRRPIVNSTYRKPTSSKKRKSDPVVKNYQKEIKKLKAEIRRRDQDIKLSDRPYSETTEDDYTVNEGSGNQMLRLGSGNDSGSTSNCECQSTLAYQNHLLLKELLKKQYANNDDSKDHVINLTVNTANADNVDKTEKNDACQNTLAYENRLILDGLILRQDSLESANKREIDKRFDMLVRILKDEIRQNMKTDLQKLNSEEYETAVADIQEKTIYKINNAEKKDYTKLPIRMEQQSGIAGVKTGYYLIANVYKNKENVDSFISDLKHKGIDAKQFFNKENGLYYVYLADYNQKNEAEMAYTTDLDGKYFSEKWIMKVNNNTATAETLFEDGE
ncbi:PorP/SprF family type IX secretion system membrane protein [Arenibacter sp. ARW7G5Y1]|uniref:PorP/SprF family type IX secretion system membrane protein n=1 Tax=Arenibacter sp. ARW7G5Y1 TaxID=2135619 RepID=UPI000D75D5C6|nr:PorP/SprF family type IX secretion system membrane protein [Arenibacter sp. ARW7G5Y1]PXX29853.1 type IX secretion system PorP/SprF family membrane protein [Arenibacter sp. ARW7G5Y1]|tara:strand:- start:12448 stop:14394 length:1947 start_codon:yes stop_codon:yes gene_type:complete